MANISTPEDIYEIIGKLMFAYGDEAEPIEKCQQFVANILRNQMMDTMNRAKKSATLRGCKKIECVDLLFLLRKKPFHLCRIYRMAKSADLLKGFNEDYEAECDIMVEVPNNSSDFCGKEAQSIYDLIGLFDVTGELQRYLKNDVKIDEEKCERLKRLSERTALMDEDDYKEYTVARTYSFCAGHGVRKAKIDRFLKWLGSPEIAPNTLMILNYIACEMICCLVEGALWSRREEGKNHFVDIYPFKALQPRHYEESLRKNKAYMIGGNILVGWFVRKTISIFVLMPIFTEFIIQFQKQNLQNAENLQHISNETIKYCYQKPDRKKSLFKLFCSRLQNIYKKSFVHSTFPIFILIAYSLLGGLIFYLIEYPTERLMLDQKKAYFKWEERSMHQILLSIEKMIRQIRSNYSNNRFKLSKTIRNYKRFALNRIDKAIYWHVLNMYHLSDQESYKAKILRPENPEIIWLRYFSDRFSQMYALRNYTDQLSLRYWEIALELNTNPIVIHHKMIEALSHFETLTGLKHFFTPTWTFWNAMFLAVTTYTTIGYGNITAQTKLGRLAVMLYATIGIPLVLMILHKLGRQSLQVLERFWNQFLSLIEHTAWINSGKSIKKKNQNGSIPLLLPIGITVGWVFLCAAVFLQFEKDWDYFKSFYFFFCSLTTIGYGDVTPTNSVDMFVIFGLVMIGLALFSMCINVLQIKLEWLFEELLETLLMEYKQKGVPVEGMKVPTKTDFLSMWRMWRKRKHQQKIRHKDTIASSLLPRFKRDRRVLLEHIRRTLCMINKSTQTDEHAYINNQYRDGISWSELSVLPVIENHSYPIKAKNTRNTDRQIMIVTPQIYESQELCMATIANGSNTLRDVSTLKGKQPVLSDQQQSVSPRRTFTKAKETVSLASHTLQVPYYMYTTPKTRQIHTNELHRLLAEIKVRIDDCRSLTDSKRHKQFSGTE
ncbi:TWiK family of potassium channels protein [Dirofilaria immitis]